MSNIIHIKTHTQLGDHMVVYGILKEYSKKYSHIFVYTKHGEQHLRNIERLYSNIKNVKVIAGEPLMAYKSIEVNAQWYKDIKTNAFNEDLIFDRYWYKLADVPFIKKFENFSFDRNLNLEKDIYYNKLGLSDNEEFILIHEDPTRNFNIRKELIPRGIKIVQVGDYQNISILDFLYTVQKAKEVHCINSVLRTFIDLMNIKHNELYYHKYTRSTESEQPGCQLKWKIIE